MAMASSTSPQLPSVWPRLPFQPVSGAPGNSREKNFRFRFSGLKCPGAVALQPHPPASDCCGDRRCAGGKTGAVRLVAREMKHLVMQGVRREVERAGVSRQHGKAGAIAEPDRACFTD